MAPRRRSRTTLADVLDEANAVELPAPPEEHPDMIALRSAAAEIEAEMDDETPGYQGDHEPGMAPAATCPKPDVE